MYTVCLIVNPQFKTPGFNERVVCQTPFCVQRSHPNGMPMFDQNTRQPVLMPDFPKTLQALQQQGFLNPQLTPQHMQVKVLGIERVAQLIVLCAQSAPQPTIAPAVVAAPYMQPVGNPGAQADILPMGPHGGYDQLPNSGLPSNADPMFGVQDAYGGAYQNVEVNTQLPRGAPGSIIEQNDLTGVTRQSDTFQSAQDRARIAQQNGWVPPRQ